MENYTHQHIDRIEQFILRARKIREVSFGGDKRRLQYLCNPNRQIYENEKGHRGLFIVDVPEEYETALLALYCRPIALAQDPILFTKVIGSLKNFFKDDKTLTNELENLRKQWLESIGTSYGYSEVFLNDQEIKATDLELAESWFYGVSFHHKDTHKNNTSAFGINKLYEAAFPVVARIAYHSFILLDFIILNRESIPLDQTVFTRQVSYDPKHYEKYTSSSLEFKDTLRDIKTLIGKTNILNESNFNNIVKNQNQFLIDSLIDLELIIDQSKVFLLFEKLKKYGFFTFSSIYQGSDFIINLLKIFGLKINNEDKITGEVKDMSLELHYNLMLILSMISSSKVHFKIKEIETGNFRKVEVELIEIRQSFIESKVNSLDEYIRVLKEVGVFIDKEIDLMIRDLIPWEITV